MPRIYTKTGDDGTTGLLYGGRVPKDDLATEAYGTTDEAVAALGLGPRVAHERCRDGRGPAGPAARAVRGRRRPRDEPPRAREARAEGVSLVTGGMARRLERRIDALVAERPLPQVFIVPGANAVERRARPGPQHRAAGRARGGRARARPTRGEPGGAAVPEPAAATCCSCSRGGRPARAEPASR